MAGTVLIVAALVLVLQLLVLGAGRRYHRVRVHVPRFSIRKANSNREMRQLERHLAKLREVTEKPGQQS